MKVEFLACSMSLWPLLFVLFYPLGAILTFGVNLWLSVSFRNSTAVALNLAGCFASGGVAFWLGTGRPNIPAFRELHENAIVVAPAIIYVHCAILIVARLVETFHRARVA